MKTPDETKKGLECCVNDMEPGDECEGCPYFEKPSRFHWICRDDKVWSDALALIQQLEAQNAELLEEVEQLEAEHVALLRDLRDADTIECEHCKFYKTDDPDCCCECGQCKRPCPCNECYHNNLWQWRGVKKEETP